MKAQGDDARQAGPAIGRLAAGYAAVSRRPRDRSAGLRTHRGDAHAGATAAAEPLLEPAGVRSRFEGLCVGGGSKLANCVVTVLPRMTTPLREA